MLETVLRVLGIISLLSRVIPSREPWGGILLVTPDFFLEVSGAGNEQNSKENSGFGRGERDLFLCLRKSLVGRNRVDTSPQRSA